jgi:hypothetical protein
VRMSPAALEAIARVAAERGCVVQSPVVGEEGIAVAALWTRMPPGGEVAGFAASTPGGEVAVADDLLQAIALGVALALAARTPGAHVGSLLSSSVSPTTASGGQTNG